MKMTSRILIVGSIVPVLAVMGSLSIPLGFAQTSGGIADFADTKQQDRFTDPSAAVSAIKAALVSGNLASLTRILGLNVERIKADEGAMKTYDDMRQGASQQIVLQDQGDRKVVAIGDKLWPLPFPLVKASDGQWSFDTKAGFQEILNRRIGENELAVIDTMREYGDIQEEYASEDRNGDGVPEYAQKLISREGEKDGLYVSKAQKGEGYFGYRFRILTGQGDHVAGGRYDYIINGNMIAGYALVAWPVRYRETGVKTFMVSKAGVVYERDLGPKTEELVRSIKRFDPDEKWDVVEE
jgi:hypothetical protein